MSALPPTSASSSSFKKFTHDVFLNFRGIDTRHGFIGHLYKALRDKGFRTFFDDEELRKGEEITPALVKAIKESRIAITVFSKNYASSSFCLDELVNIMECFKEHGSSVLPVFYDVHPRDVRHQIGTYGEALLAQRRFNEKWQKWREALRQAANLSGDDFKFGNEYEYVFIEKITKEVSKIINRTPLEVAKYPVGLGSRVQDVDSLLKEGPNDGVHMVGIVGIGGIGKSTLARAVYNLIANRFDSSCFLSDVREDSIKYGLEYVQEKFLSKIVGEDNIKLGSVHEGIQIIKQRLQGKKVLLVLDNVDNCYQLDAMAGAPDWFGPGSRVIITTRAQDLLINHRIERKYEVECLSATQSRELFTWHAFKCDKVDPNFTEVIDRAIAYASGLPLALELIGSSLFRKDIKAWKSALDLYKRSPGKRIQNILKASFDILEEVHQEIFLDIACCLKGFHLTEVDKILHAHYGQSMYYAIIMLAQNSLIKIDLRDWVTLHDVIQDAGRALGKHSRLGLHEEIVEVLQNDTGTDKIEMINLKFPNKIGGVVEWNRNAFRKMPNLKTLIFSGGCSLAKDVVHLPNSLRVLRWERYPSTCLPRDFRPEELAILSLPWGCLESLQWVSAPKKFVNMKELSLSGLPIEQIPDVSGLPNLEKLVFEFCMNLIEIHKSIGVLKKLKILRARNCRKLKSFPSLELSSLEELDLSACLALEKFPEISGKMENVTKLELDDMYSIKEFPSSIQNLTRLQKMHLKDIGSFKFPIGILALQELDDLTIEECKGLLLPNEDEGDGDRVSNATHLRFRNCNMPPEFVQTVIPRFPNVRRLSLTCANFTILPECIEKCHFLRKLRLVDCKKLEEIRGIPPNIEHLFVIRCTSLSSETREKLLSKEWHEEGGDKMIILPGTEIPEWFELKRTASTFSIRHRNKFKFLCEWVEIKRTESKISFWFRNKFPAISLCFKHEPGQKSVDFSPTLKINYQTKVYPLFEMREVEELMVENIRDVRDYQENHIYIIDKIQGTFKDYEDGMLLENEWNRAVVYPRNVPGFNVPGDGVRVQIGLHIIKERNSMDDISFTNPWLHKKRHRSVNTGDSQSDKDFMQRQLQLPRRRRQLQRLWQLLRQPLRRSLQWVQHPLQWPLQLQQRLLQWQLQGRQLQRWLQQLLQRPLQPRLQLLEPLLQQLHQSLLQQPLQWELQQQLRRELQRELQLQLQQPQQLPQLQRELQQLLQQELQQELLQRRGNLASSKPHDEGQGKESFPLHPPSTMNDDVNWGPSSKRVRSTSIVTVQVKSRVQRRKRGRPYTLNVNWDSNSKQMISTTTTTLNVQGSKEEQNLTSIDKYKLEGCGSVDKACNSNAREDKGKNPITELLSTTKEETEIYQPASNDETMAWDPMEVEYQPTIGSNNKSTRSNETGLEELPLAKRQFCLCSLFSSLVSLCASSSSLDSP